MPGSATSGKTTSPTQDPEPLEEVTPSRLTLWAEMLEHESEEAVAEVMESLLKTTMDRCFQTDIRQQIVPYTTNWMKNCLVQVVEQHILCRDLGNRPDEVLLEDSEPPTAELDTWAKGCVPLVTPSPPLRPISPKQVEVIQQEIKPEVLQKRRTNLQPKVSSKLPAKKASSKLAVANINKHNRLLPPAKNEKKNRKVPTDAKQSKFLPPLCQSTKILISEKVEDEHRSSAVSKKSASQILPNKHKAIQKLDPATLPDLCIFPKYEIVHPDAKTQKVRAKEPQQKHSKHKSEWTVKSQRSEADVKPTYRTVASSEPLRLEAMTLAKEVTLSQSLDLSQPMDPPKTPQVRPTLRPIRTEPVPFKFSADQFFIADPQVKPLSQT